MGRKIFQKIKLNIFLNLIKHRTLQIQDDRHTEQNKYKEANEVHSSQNVENRK